MCIYVMDDRRAGLMDGVSLLLLLPPFLLPPPPCLVGVGVGGSKTASDTPTKKKGPRIQMEDPLRILSPDRRLGHGENGVVCLATSVEEKQVSLSASLSLFCVVLSLHLSFSLILSLSRSHTHTRALSLSSLSFSFLSPSLSLSPLSLSSSPSASLSPLILYFVLFSLLSFFLCSLSRCLSHSFLSSTLCSLSHFLFLARALSDSAWGRCRYLHMGWVQRFVVCTSTSTSTESYTMKVRHPSG